MPASLWFAIVTAITALVAFAATAVFRRTDDALAPLALLTALVSGGLTVLLVVVASVNIVGTRQVGIATSFGRPTGATYGNGLHFTPPWVEVHEMDGAVHGVTSPATWTCWPACHRPGRWPGTPGPAPTVPCPR